MAVTETPCVPAGGAAAPDLRNLEKVRGIFASLSRFVNARAIYQSNNPGYINAARVYEQAFRSFFETDKELLLTVEQYRLTWQNQVVYDIGCNTESIAFLLYKDGIGEISIQSTVDRSELEHLAGILTGALYNPSAQFDTATAFWQAEFANIFYRVLDEQADTSGSEGAGSGVTQREQPLRANDHMGLPNAGPAPTGHRSDSSLDTLGAYFNSLLEGEAAPRNPADHESRLQAEIDGQLKLDPADVASWLGGHRAGTQGDELILFLRLLLDFTRQRCSPPVARDINDGIERLVHYIRDEAHIGTLAATLELAAELKTDSLDASFASIPARIETELTDGAYLMSLVQGFRGNNTPHALLGYLRLVPEKNAIAALCELLARSTDVGIHEKGCEMLIAIGGDEIETIIERFDVENTLLAGDAVRLLSRRRATTVAPVIHRMLASKDTAVRHCPVDYLADLGTDEAARLVCGLLKDADAAVRTRAFAALGASVHPLIIDEVMSLCFAEQAAARTPEEQEVMFRALGKAAGAQALPRLRQSVEKKQYLPGARTRLRREKLLAITALRYIPGEDARRMVERLADDGDTLVKAKAQHVLKRPEGMGSDVYSRAAAASGQSGEDV